MRMLFNNLVNRYAKSIKTARLQGEFDKTFCKMVESPTWEALCRQVFDQYLGQLSFTPVSQIHLLVEKLPITSRSHVLELAPGTGGLSLYLAKLTGCRLTGLDASPLAAKIANKRAMLEGLAERVHFEVGILPELPYQDCSFDFVISIDSVYSVDDKVALFRGCYRVLRPSGHLGFYTLYRQRKLCDDEMHARAFGWFPPHPYSRLLKQAGFKNTSKLDLTEDLIRLSKCWVEALQKNRAALDKEMGENTIKSLRADIETAWTLATEGYLGRALFKAQKRLVHSEGKKTLHPV